MYSSLSQPKPLVLRTPPTNVSSPLTLIAVINGVLVQARRNICDSERTSWSRDSTKYRQHQSDVLGKAMDFFSKVLITMIKELERVLECCFEG